MTEFGRIESALRAFFAEKDWPVDDEVDNVLAVPVVASNGNWRGYGVIREAEQQLIFYSALHVEVADLDELVRYITRANFGLVLGNFELDLDDGELRFKTSIDVEDAELSPALIRHVVLANIAMANQYLPGVRAIADGQSADQAIALVESAPDRTLP